MRQLLHSPHMTLEERFQGLQYCLAHAQRSTPVAQSLATQCQPALRSLQEEYREAVAHRQMLFSAEGRRQIEKSREVQERIDGPATSGRRRGMMFKRRGVDYGSGGGGGEVVLPAARCDAPVLMPEGHYKDAMERLLSEAVEEVAEDEKLPLARRIPLMVEEMLPIDFTGVKPIDILVVDRRDTDAHARHVANLSGWHGEDDESPLYKPPPYPHAASVFFAILQHKKGPLQRGKGYDVVTSFDLLSHQWVFDRVRSKAMQFFGQYWRFEKQDDGSAKRRLHRDLLLFLLKVSEKLFLLAMHHHAPALRARQTQLEHRGNEAMQRALLGSLHLPPRGCDVREAFGLPRHRSSPNPLSPTPIIYWQFKLLQNKPYVLDLRDDDRNLPTWKAVEQMLSTTPLKHRRFTAYLELTCLSDETAQRFWGEGSPRPHSGTGATGGAYSAPLCVAITQELLMSLAKYLLALWSPNGADPALMDMEYGPDDGHHVDKPTVPDGPVTVMVVGVGASRLAFYLRQLWQSLRKSSRRTARDHSSVQFDWEGDAPASPGPAGDTTLPSRGGRRRRVFRPSADKADSADQVPQVNFISVAVRPERIVNSVRRSAWDDEALARAADKSTTTPPLPVEPACEDSSETLIDSATGCVRFPYDEDAKLSDALHRHQPNYALCVGMPPGRDWTFHFRKHPSVQEYMVLGPRDSPLNGNLRLTWGQPLLFDKADPSDAPFVRDGFRRFNATAVSKQCIGTLDSPEVMGHTWATVFRRVYSLDPKARTALVFPPAASLGW
ncbi:unnamed protein product [Vitrella brassicaformis CCMP3155]|uniref:Uncharacterized protein n=1 Tax=Vitrella brassicaformis (strain CCMP3155) TaxID=1169540 RepID=A0A0G4EIN0_VITBC|nr:unnamed protein product [Vitrella brassicaformis CCMP3155]|eukprot:CEL95747.1 unnamed protein product [Vitrella brassicaformis CCMP3155]